MLVVAASVTPAAATTVHGTPDGHGLTWRASNELIRVESFGVDGIRVRMTNGRSALSASLPGAILPVPEVNHTMVPPKVSVGTDNRSGTIINGAIRAVVQSEGWPPNHDFSGHGRPTIRFEDTTSGALLCGEYYPDHGPPARALFAQSRGSGAQMSAQLSFIAFDDEELYGLGQHQHGRLDQKGMVIDLEDYNTEVPIPLLLSRRRSTGQVYGFLWNVPSAGRVELAANNRTRWVADAAWQVDYLVLTGTSLFDVLARYMEATGHPPPFPRWASGYWQCKLRYATQTELLNVGSRAVARSLARPRTRTSLPGMHHAQEVTHRFRMPRLSTPHAWCSAHNTPPRAARTP